MIVDRKQVITFSQLATVLNFIMQNYKEKKNTVNKGTSLKVCI